MPEILIEFLPDFSKLESGIDKLTSDGTISKEMAALFTDAGKTIDQFAGKFAKLGEPAQKALKPAIDAAKKSVKDLSTSGIKDLGELKKRVDGITKSFTEGFGEGVEQALKEAGISMEQFNTILKKTTDTDKSLKAELREINEEMARLKLNGQDNTQQYEELSQRAGQYRDALQDVNEEINRQASDTGKLDVAIRFVTGLASAYSVLQGVQALAGKDNEELQKTLLKVNAAMAILNGLQGIQNELKRKDNILTIAQTGLQKLYAVVVGTSTGAMKAFRVALAATGVGLLVIGLVELISAMSRLGDVSKEVEKEIDNLSLAIDKQNQILDDNNRKLETANQLRILRLKELGKSQLEINAATVIGLNQQANASEQLADRQVFSIKKILDLYSLQVSGVRSAQEAIDFFRARGADKEVELIEKILANYRNAEQIRTEITLFNAEQRTKRAEEGRDKEKKLSEESADLLKKQREEEQQQILAAIRRKLLDVAEGSNDELVLRKQLAIKTALFEIENQKLVGDKRKEALRKVQLEIEELDKEFGNKRKTAALENELSIINAQLDAIGISYQEQERLTIEKLEKQRELELSAIKNNKTKEKEINAKFDKEIIEQRKKIREDAFAEEQADEERKNFIRRKRDEEGFSDPNLEFDQRRKFVNDIADMELASFTRRRLFNQSQLQAGLQDLEDYQKNAETINNDAFVAQSNREKQLTAITKEESDKRKEKFQEDLDFILGLANQLTAAFSSFQETMNANEDARIEAQKDNLQRLREGNAITEKEFLARMKTIEKAEKETKQKQAERDKSLALFEAAINGASAIIKALSQGGIVLAAVTTALVAAQIAAISARPIPKFGKGTKSAPKGFAEVGETGTELIQMGDKYFVAEHPQVIWMKGGERVYNPEETKDILTPQANMTVINNTNGVSHENKVDYEKMAKKIGEEIAKHPRSVISLDEDGFSVHISNKLNTQKYLNKRFTFHD